MTSTAQLLTRDKFETCLSVIRQASLQILPLLKIRAADGKDPQWFFQQLEQARQSMGSWAAVARRLNLNDAEISQFTLSLRHLQQLVPQYESGQEVSDNQLISALRFVSYLELVRSKQPLLSYSTDLAVEGGEQQQMAQRQIRALELMLRGLINRAWGSQPQLVNHLKTQFGADKVRRWLKNAERGDILSGLRFSELSLLLVDKKEFARHYAALYQNAPQLSLLIDKRKTLQTFLDDIRQIRNDLMQQRPLTTVQIALLDNYYRETSSPVQRAFDEGRTKVNPAALLAGEEPQLQEFIAQAQKKHAANGGDNEDISDTIARPDLRNANKHHDAAETASVALWAMVGVVIVGMVIFALFIVNDATRPPQDAAQTRVITTAMAADHPPENDSPRDMLANMGIAWDENSLRSAIERGDSRIIRLFMQGGMNWKASYAESALAADYRDALTTLLQYRKQMDELRPCRRMVNTTSQAMKDGQSLTSMRKQFLQAFCSSPGVIKRQKEELERALLRQAAQKRRYEESKAQGLQPEPLNTDEVEIQQAIYNALR
ncbi:STY4199 family HEPN domain-containing protein [Enterobacteriaceae bacterium H18W14]|uniref:STY4199 family HEPN domain-containing protein n=1 Tax=Dryocola boscaweniae TaxID=2925397 RepID=UPI0022EFDC8E|nr:STY4199 family HEPN domain-containing protein [Dryocola boscaweniae]MCT4715737.1 STY4199 family HEPN domain-containing protein [Dryocola boscaweniae]